MFPTGFLWHENVYLREIASIPIGECISFDHTRMYVDDCCELCNRINNKFGPHVSVKLDLFHTMQRITKTIPKNHVHALQFLKELSLVFRMEGEVSSKDYEQEHITTFLLAGTPLNKIPAFRELLEQYAYQL